MAIAKNEVRPSESERIALWEIKKDEVRKILTSVLNDRYRGKGQIIEDAHISIFGNYVVRPNLAMVPEVPYCNVDRVTVCLAGDLSYNIFKLTYTSNRNVIWNAQINNLHETILQMINRF